MQQAALPRHTPTTAQQVCRLTVALEGEAAKQNTLLSTPSKGPFASLEQRRAVAQGAHSDQCEPCLDQQHNLEN